MSDEADGPERDEAMGKYRAPALEKGLDIIQLLSSSPAPLTVTAICARLGRSQGEIFRMVQVLQMRGFIAQDPQTDGYALTDLLFSMVMRQPRTQGLIEAAIPIMRSLTSAIGQSCHIALYSRGDIVVVARMESVELIGFTVRVGFRRPLHQANSGRVLYAFQPDDIRERWLAEISPSPEPAELAPLIADADGIRAAGFVKGQSLFVGSVTDLSVPIMRGDRAAAALTVPYLETTQPPREMALVIEELMRAGAAISEQLSEADSRA